MTYLGGSSSFFLPISNLILLWEYIYIRTTLFLTLWWNAFIHFTWSLGSLKTSFFVLQFFCRYTSGTRKGVCFPFEYKPMINAIPSLFSYTISPTISKFFIPFSNKRSSCKYYVSCPMISVLRGSASSYIFTCKQTSSNYIYSFSFASFALSSSFSSCWLRICFIFSAIYPNCSFFDSRPANSSFNILFKFCFSATSFYFLEMLSSKLDYESLSWDVASLENVLNLYLDFTLLLLLSAIYFWFFNRI